MITAELQHEGFSTRSDSIGTRDTILPGTVIKLSSRLTPIWQLATIPAEPAALGRPFRLARQAEVA